nr:hypothetical protein [Candidatus Sigynarchaeota archaeon]
MKKAGVYALVMIALLFATFTVSAVAASNQGQYVYPSSLALTNQLPLITGKHQSKDLTSYLQDGDTLNYSTTQTSFTSSGNETKEGYYTAKFEKNPTDSWFRVEVNSNGTRQGYYGIYITSFEAAHYDQNGVLYNTSTPTWQPTLESGCYSPLVLPPGLMKYGAVHRITLPIFMYNETPVYATVKGKTTLPLDSGVYEVWRTQLYVKYTDSSGVSWAVSAVSFNEINSGIALAMYYSASFIGPDELGVVAQSFILDLEDTTCNYIRTTANMNQTMYTGSTVSPSLNGKWLSYKAEGYVGVNFDLINSSWGLGVQTVSLTSDSYVNVSFHDISASWLNVTTFLKESVQIPPQIWSLLEQWNSTLYNGTSNPQHILSANTTESFNVSQGHLRNINESSILFTPVLLPMIAKEGDPVTMAAFLCSVVPTDSEVTLGVFGFPISARIFTDVPLVINGQVYDTWKVSFITPDNINLVNITRLEVNYYFERTSGIVLRYEVHVDYSYPPESDFPLIGYHKTYTLENSNLMGEEGINPAMFFDYGFTFATSIDSGTQRMFDPSLASEAAFNVTPTTDIDVLMHMSTVQPECVSSLPALPVVKYVRITFTGVGAYISNVSNAVIVFRYFMTEFASKHLRSYDLHIYAYNPDTNKWVPLNTTNSPEGCYVYADATNFLQNLTGKTEVLFALTASPMSIWEILGPGGSALLLYYLGKQLNPWSDWMPPLAIVCVAAVVAVAVVAIYLRRK